MNETYRDIEEREKDWSVNEQSRMCVSANKMYLDRACVHVKTRCLRHIER